MEFQNLLIVGAGFSKNAGLPLASQFTSALLNTDRLYVNGPSNALVKLISEFVDKTFADAKNTLPEDWPELEDIFTLVDLSANTGHHLGSYSASDLRLVRRAMIVRMIRMFTQTYGRRQRKPDRDWDLLEELFEHFDEKTTAVLSMNWDTVIESGVARNQNIDNFDYGCDASFKDFDNNGELKKYVKRGNRRLFLTKPHGSVNWLYCDSCRSVFWVPPSSVMKVADTLFRAHDWEALKELTALRKVPKHSSPACPNCKVKALGSRFATFSYRKALDFPMHAASWRTAERHLQEALDWIFFGYSMPSADFEFKYLLKRVQISTKPRITVITGGDGANDTVKRFKKFFGEVDGERFYFDKGLNLKVISHLRHIGVLGPEDDS